ncbi:MAG: isoprenylcysteine carboxylmethyltransferase family protein [Anaerolineales bacterium]
MANQRLDRNGIKRILMLFAFLLLIQFVLTISSGDLLWWNAWVFIGGYSLWLCVIFIVMIKVNPNLLNERGKKHEDTKPFDRIVLIVYAVLFISVPVVAGMDHRFEISSVPGLISVLAILLTIPVFSLVLWAFIVNNHFETTVRIQNDREHQVCSDGPYRLIRHPTYLAAIVGFVLIPIILGTLLALIPCLMMAILFIIRTKFEDNTLLEELEGYKEYSQSTRYRLIPGVW